MLCGVCIPSLSNRGPPYAEKLKFENVKTENSANERCSCMYTRPRDTHTGPTSLCLIHARIRISCALGKLRRPVKELVLLLRRLKMRSARRRFPARSRGSCRRRELARVEAPPILQGLVPLLRQQHEPLLACGQGRSRVGWGGVGWRWGGVWGEIRHERT